MGDVWIAIVGLGAALIFCLLALAYVIRDYSRKLAEMRAPVHSLDATLNALCAGAVGVDRRLSGLEKKGRDMAHRQDSMESQKQSDRPYGEAIQLVHRGATIDRLVAELGLSHSEAELVVMLHGMKQAS
jgi:hypothetical protein